MCLSTDVTGALVLSLSIDRFGSPGVSCTGFHLSVVYGVCLSADVTGALFPPTSQSTCESVHRRDRFTRTPSSVAFSLFPVVSLLFSSPLAIALVCPSTDVTGALVPSPPSFFFFSRYVTPSPLPLGTFTESCRNMSRPNKQQLMDSTTWDPGYLNGTLP